MTTTTPAAAFPSRYWADRPVPIKSRVTATGSGRNRIESEAEQNGAFPATRTVAMDDNTTAALGDDEHFQLHRNERKTVSKKEDPTAVVMATHLQLIFQSITSL